MGEKKYPQPGKMTSQQAAAVGRLGGLASGRARRQKKTFRQVFLALLPQVVAVDDLDSIAGLAGQDGQITCQQAIAMALCCKAMRGDISAFQAIRDTIGEKPGQKVENQIEGGVTISLAPELEDYAE